MRGYREIRAGAGCVENGSSRVVACLERLAVLKKESFRDGEVFFVRRDNGDFEGSKLIRTR